MSYARKTVISGLTLIGLLLLTNPADIAVSLLLLLPLSAVYFVYSLFRLTSSFFLYNLSPDKIKALGSFGIIFPGIIFLLGAFHQLKLVDVFLSLVLATGVTFYIFRTGTFSSVSQNE